jgi:hypothetical protein
MKNQPGNDSRGWWKRQVNSLYAPTWQVMPGPQTRLLKKATGMGCPWQQSFGVLKDWSYAAKRRRAHTIVRKQEPMLICLTYDALLSLEFD